MCLTQVKKGQKVSIVKINDEQIRTQFIRFGIGEGSYIQCLEKVPFGPVMFGHKRQEIAIGQSAAKNIIVTGDI